MWREHCSHCSGYSSVVVSPIWHSVKILAWRKWKPEAIRNLANSSAFSKSTGCTFCYDFKRQIINISTNNAGVLLRQDVARLCREEQLQPHSANLYVLDIPRIIFIPPIWSFGLWILQRTMNSHSSRVYHANTIDQQWIPMWRVKPRLCTLSPRSRVLDADTPTWSARRRMLICPSVLENSPAKRLAHNCNNKRILGW